MSVQIRCATSSDGPAVAQIVRQSFDENIEPGSPRIRKVLRANGTYVAIIGDDVVGFVSNFLTRSAEGLRRFELDLLAVASQARGNGIGDQLVGYSIARASQSGAEMIRSLVATHNRAMQRICKGHGFARSSGSYSLFVAEASADSEGEFAGSSRSSGSRQNTYLQRHLAGRRALASCDRRGPFARCPRRHVAHRGCDTHGRLADRRAAARQSIRFGRRIPLVDGQLENRLTLNNRSLCGVLPCSARSVNILPIIVLNLNPCPLKPAPITTCWCSG